MAAEDGERIQKLLARAGLGSRRGMEECLRQGRVRRNGAVAQLGERARMGDELLLDGQRVALRLPPGERRRALLYFKPPGEICARRDLRGRPNVYHHLPPAQLPWIIVGRLDFNTSGVLLFTDDGEFASALMHPRRAVEREYLVRVSGEVDPNMARRLCAGVMLDGTLARFDDIQPGRSPDQCVGRNRWYGVVVTEGRNRLVRRLLESQGLQVSRLKRVRYGNVALSPALRQGNWRLLAPGEIGELARLAGLRSSARASQRKIG